MHGGSSILPRPTRHAWAISLPNIPGLRSGSSGWYLGGLGQHFGDTMEAKVNMSARIAKVNREWVRAQAYSRRLTMSQVVDIIIEEARKASKRSKK